MLDQYMKDPDLTAIVDMFDWYVLPVLNPDGYAYTWLKQDVSYYDILFCYVIRCCTKKLKKK